MNNGKEKENLKTVNIHNKKVDANLHIEIPDFSVNLELQVGKIERQDDKLYNGIISIFSIIY